ncbi:MAG: hypothetical protein ABFS86_08500 [Planctomycetota bacterium]
MTTERDRKDRRDRPISYFSCAFCSETSEKPFKICDSCGTTQPAGEKADGEKAEEE